MAMLTYADIELGDLEKLRESVIASPSVLSTRLLDSNSGARATPLCVAAEAGQIEIVKFLLAQGSDPDDGGEIGGSAYSPLTVAAEYGFPEAIEILLSASADINALNFGLWFPLYIAVEHDQVKSLEALLKHATHIDFAREGYHGTALELAEKKGRHEMVQMLRAAAVVVSAASITARV